MDLGTKGEVSIAFKRHLGRHSAIERTEQASFDTDRSWFIEQASILIDALEKYVTDARARRR